MRLARWIQPAFRMATPSSCALVYGKAQSESAAKVMVDVRIAYCCSAAGSRVKGQMRPDVEGGWCNCPGAGIWDRSAD